MEYKGTKVIKKPSFCQFIPGLSYTAQAGFSYIFVTPKVFNNISSKNPDPRDIAFLEHEKKHIERQKELGNLNFFIKYLFSSEFRFQEELLADKEQMKYLKQNKLEYDIERSAKFMSSWLYLWMVKYERAKRELEKIWKEKN